VILIIQGRAAGRDDDYQQEAETIHASRQRIVCVVKGTGKVVAVEPKDIVAVKLSQQVTLRFNTAYVETNPAIDATPHPL
jgi:hypothetical protein